VLGLSHLLLKLIKRVIGAGCDGMLQCIVGIFLHAGQRVAILA
jgi:hypothetical protein